MENISLVTALGKNKDLILEILDFLNTKQQFHYSPDTLNTRKYFTNHKINNLYLICTDVPEINQIFDELDYQIKNEFFGINTHKIDLGVNDISTSKEDKITKDKIDNLFENLSSEKIIISSGGRKTLTNRMIESGMKYGCMGYLSVVGDYGIKRTDYDKIYALWQSETDIIKEKWQKTEELYQGMLGSSFRSLNILPINLQKKLRKEKIGTEKSKISNDIDWLHRLPKADLHCHLGGCQDENTLKELASQLIEDLKISKKRIEKFTAYICNLLSLKKIKDITSHDFRKLNTRTIHSLQNLTLVFQNSGEEEYISTAILLSQLSTKQIKDISRDGKLTIDGIINWPEHSANSLIWYMKCGDLGGSNLLQSENTLRTSLKNLLKDSFAENICYLEIRCSPDNYTKSKLLTSKDVMDILLDEANKFMQQHNDFKVNFIIMATRHKDPEDIKQSIATAVRCFQDINKNSKDISFNNAKMVGFDLAGQEKGYDPSKFSDEFIKLHKEFANITIHAGEMTDDEKIWQAIYNLHAKRIGHGLKLIDNPKMISFVRDYGLAIEMCPSSNYQTNSFRNFSLNKNITGKTYPLKEYLNKGVIVTINTDNRFISDTNMTNELLLASQLTENGLTKWEILKLIKNSFQSAFLPKDQKDQLIKKIDNMVLSLILS